MGTTLLLMKEKGSFFLQINPVLYTFNRSSQAWNNYFHFLSSLSINLILIDPTLLITMLQNCLLTKPRTLSQELMIQNKQLYESRIQFLQSSKG